MERAGHHDRSADLVFPPDRPALGEGHNHTGQKLNPHTQSQRTDLSPGHAPSISDAASLSLKPGYFEAWFHFPEPPNPLPAAFGVITPCNPFGRTLPADQNASRLAQLAAHLAAREIGHFRADGGSRDGRHQEAGFGVVGLTLAELRQLGVQFGQDAIFWVENDQVLLVSCAGVDHIALGKWSERQTSWPSPLTPESESSA